MSQLAALELLREAMAAARANNPARTRELLMDVTRLDHANETAWQWLAEVAESPLEATVALEQVLLLNPKNEKARSALRPIRLQAGIAAAKNKDIASARRLLRTAVADDPGSEQGWFWLASVCDSPFEALSYLQRVLQLNPQNAAAKKGIDYYNNKLSKITTAIPTVATTRSVPAAIESAAPITTPLPRKLLVIDTSRTVRKLVTMATVPDGCLVTEAADAEEGLERLREEGPFDLVLIDAALPGKDGQDFCRIVRQATAPARIPIVLFAGKDGLRGRKADCDQVLHKPFDTDSVMHAVNTCCPLEAIPVA